MEVCLRQCGVAWGIPARLTAAPNTFDTLWIRVPIYLGFVWAKTQGVSGQFLSHTRLSLNSAAYARLVYEGMALAYRKYSKRYVPEEDKASAAKRGLWAGEFVAPWDWRKGKRLDQEEAPIACCKICNKGKACGNSCIKKTYNCSKPKGCACDS